MGNMGYHWGMGMILRPGLRAGGVGSGSGGARGLPRLPGAGRGANAAPHCGQVAAAGVGGGLRLMAYHWGMATVRRVRWPVICCTGSRSAPPR